MVVLPVNREISGIGCRSRNGIGARRRCEMSGNAAGQGWDGGLDFFVVCQFDRVFVPLSNEWLVFSGSGVYSSAALDCFGCACCFVTVTGPDASLRYSCPKTPVQPVVLILVMKTSVPVIY